MTDLIHPLDIFLVEVSSSLYGAPSVDENGRFCEWVTRQPSASVLLRLPGNHLLSTLVIHNKSTSLMTIQIGLRATKGKLMTVFEEHRLPHDRVTHLPVGHLPCQYVKLECLRGSPVSLGKVEAFGVPLKALQARGGQDGLAPLLFEGTKDVLFRRHKHGAVKKKPSGGPVKRRANDTANANADHLLPPQTQQHSEAEKNEGAPGAALPPSKLRWVQADDSSSSGSEDSDEVAEEGAEKGNHLGALSSGEASKSGMPIAIGNISRCVQNDNGEGDASWSDLL